MGEWTTGIVSRDERTQRAWGDDCSLGEVPRSEPDWRYLRDSGWRRREKGLRGGTQRRDAGRLPPVVSSLFSRKSAH